jgi:hypothetical protein
MHTKCQQAVNTQQRLIKIKILFSGIIWRRPAGLSPRPGAVPTDASAVAAKPDHAERGPPTDRSVQSRIASTHLAKPGKI